MGHHHQSAQDSIHRFIETYNSEYLLPGISPALVLPQLNTTQKVLYDNYLKLQKTPGGHQYWWHFQFLEGPYYFQLLKGTDRQQNKLTFLLFGENHDFNDKGQCSLLDAPLTVSNVTPIITYIQHLAQNTPNFLDIYVEFPQVAKNKPLENLVSLSNEVAKSVLHVFIKKPQLFPVTLQSFVQENNTKKESVLEHFFTTFQHCFEPTQQQALNVECQLARFHFLDIRQNMTPYTPNSPLHFMDRLEVVQPLLNQFTEVDPNTRDYWWVPYMITKTTNKYAFVRFGVHHFLKFFGLYSFLQKLAKQQPSFSGLKSLSLAIRSIPVLQQEFSTSAGNPQVRRAILEFLSQKLEEYIHPAKLRLQWSTLVQRGGDTGQTSVKVLLDAVKFISSYFFLLNSTLMDCYCLCRIFRFFTPDKKHELEQPSKPSTIVIYTGAAHTMRYFQFLKYLSAKQLFFPTYVTQNINDNPVISCVKLPVK